MILVSVLKDINLSNEDLFQLPSSLVRGPIAEQTSNAHEAIVRLRAVYSSKIGYDYYHLNCIEERKWFRNRAESGAYRPPNDPINERMLLESLTQVEVFERFSIVFSRGNSAFQLRVWIC